MRILLPTLFVVIAVAAFAAEPMERAQDTAAVWEHQAAEAATAADAAPVFTGAYVWSGRADRNYKPFFQWELRLTGGSEDIQDLKARVIPLAPDLTPLDSQVRPHWVRLGDLAAGAETDTSYKLNTSIFPAYRVELEWRGGDAAYLATSRTALPSRSGASPDSPELVVVEPVWERNQRGQCRIEFWLRNQGGKDASEVVVTLKLKDADGSVVMEHEHIPEDGTVPAGYAKLQEVRLQKTPSFATISAATRSAESGGFTIDGGSFSDAETVEVAEVAAADGVIAGKVRNGFPEPVTGVQIRVEFTGNDGASVGSVTATVDQLAPGAIAEWSADISAIPAWVGFATALDYGMAGETSGDVEAGAGGTAAGASIDVDGVVFTVLETAAAGGALKIRGRVGNQTGGDLQELTVTVDIAGAAAPVDLHVGDLADGAEFEGSMVAEGVDALTGLGISWATGG